MRDLLRKKFKANKWFYISTSSKEFKDLLNLFTLKISIGEISVSDAIDLIKSFKAHKKAWLKFKSVKGRNNLFCECLLITKNNIKIKTELNCDTVINSEVLSSSPKSLKLYSLYNSKSVWFKKDDFVDPIEYPKVEDELTECGYELYKSWQIEKKKLKDSGNKVCDRYWCR